LILKGNNDLRKSETGTRQNPTIDEIMSDISPVTKSNNFDENMMNRYKEEQQVCSSDEGVNPMENVHKYETELIN